MTSHPPNRVWIVPVPSFPSHCVVFPPFITSLHCSSPQTKPSGKGFTSRKCCATPGSDCKAGQFDKENVVPAVDINSLKTKGTSLIHSHNKKLSTKSPPKLCPPRSNTILRLAQQPPTSFLTPQSEGHSSCTALPFPRDPSDSILSPQPEQLKLATPESLPQETRLPRPAISPPIEAPPTVLDETVDLLQEAPSPKERNPETPGQGNVEEVVVPRLDSIHKPIPKLVNWKPLQVLHSPEKPCSPILAQTETVKQPGQGDHRALDAESEIFEIPGNLDGKYNSTYEDSLTPEEEHLLKESLEACMPSLSPVLRSLPSLHSATPNVDKLLQRKVHSRRLHDRQLLYSAVAEFDEPECHLRKQPLLPEPSRCTQSGVDCGMQHGQHQTGSKVNRAGVNNYQVVPVAPGNVTHRKAGLKGDNYSTTPGKSFSKENVNMDGRSNIGNVENECIPGNTQTLSLTVTEITEDGDTSQECVSTSMKAKSVKQRRKRGRPPNKQLSPPSVMQNNVSSTTTYSQPEMTAQVSCQPHPTSDSTGFQAVQSKEIEKSSKASTPNVTRKRQRKVDTEQYLPMRVTRRTAALRKALLEESPGKVTADPLPAAKRLRTPPTQAKSGGTVENAIMRDEECMQKPGERPSSPSITTSMNASIAEASRDTTVPSENRPGTTLRNMVQALPGESTVTKVPILMWRNDCIFESFRIIGAFFMFHLQTSLSPVQQNLMCDLFLCMTPDRQKYGFSKDQSSSIADRRYIFVLHTDSIVQIIGLGL